MTFISRTLAVALVGLSLGLGATSSAHAGLLGDVVFGVAKVGKRVLADASGASTVAAGLAAGAMQRCLRNANSQGYCDTHYKDYYQR